MFLLLTVSFISLLGLSAHVQMAPIFFISDLKKKKKHFFSKICIYFVSNSILTCLVQVALGYQEDIVSREL